MSDSTVSRPGNFTYKAISTVGRIAYRPIAAVRRIGKINPFPPPVAAVPIILFALVLACDFLAYSVGRHLVLGSFILLGIGILAGLRGLWGGIADFCLLGRRTRARRIASAAILLTVIGLGALTASYFVRYGYRLELETLDPFPTALAAGGFVSLVAAFLLSAAFVAPEARRCYTRVLPGTLTVPSLFPSLCVVAEISGDLLCRRRRWRLFRSLWRFLPKSPLLHRGSV